MSNFEHIPKRWSGDIGRRSIVVALMAFVWATEIFGGEASAQTEPATAQSSHASQLTASEEEINRVYTAAMTGSDECSQEDASCRTTRLA